MKKKYTVYTQDARYFKRIGWQSACRSQSDDLVDSLIWVKQFDSSWIAWKIVENETKKIIETNVTK